MIMTETHTHEWIKADSQDFFSSRECDCGAIKDHNGKISY